MNGNITLSIRTFVIGLVVLVALVVAYLLGSSGGGSPAAARATDDDTASSDPAPPRELTMTGTGDASAVPDQLSFSLEVHLTRPELDAALEAANRSMARVLGSLKEHGVDKGDVQTTGLSMDPVYDYPNYGPPVLRGYRVSERANVLVGELEQGGAAVSAAVAAGGNEVRVDNLKLLVGDTDVVMEQARDAAVDEARAKAEQYAAASGEELGDVATISEVKTRPLPTPVEGYAALSRVTKDLAAMPIRAGRDEASVTVRIVWHLK
ncbi:SIMPL domain-containing protein [Nocardioides endophyticus]|uniref:SIMPL domain-containing protein n=1 Tax=Nocardioides endophyticus TaxID=1353775 RepID=A0ABP8ZBC1_9ACTN